MKLTITCIAIYYLFLTAFLCKWTYHHQHIHRKAFSEGEELYADVTSLTSPLSLLTFSYYSLPYCKPQIGVTQPPVDFGQKLIGEQVFSSPYRFRINRNESLFLCASPLTRREINRMMKLTREYYQFNFILNNLPALSLMPYISPANKLQGVPIGMRVFWDVEYFYNHLKFRVWLHEITGRNSEETKYEIVGFQVSPFTAVTESKPKMYDTVKPHDCWGDDDCNTRATEKRPLVFSYEVEYNVVNLTWSSRWDWYVYSRGAEFQWMSVVSSVIVVTVITGYVLYMFRKRRTKPPVRVESEEDGNLRRGLLEREVSSIEGNARRRCLKLLCSVLATGLQITCTAALTVSFSALGLMSESSRGGFLTLTVVFYLFSSPVAGYTSVFLLRILSGSADGWRAVAYQTGSLFPLVLVSVWTVANYIHYTNGSTAVASATVYGTVFLLWALVSFPLAVLGGLLASEHGGWGIELRLDIVRSSEQTLRQKIFSWIYLFGNGYLPFNMMSIQLDSVLSSFRFGRIYSTFGALPVTVLLSFIAHVEGSIVLANGGLLCEDKRWWQKLLLSSFSCGFFFFVYLMMDFPVNLVGIMGPASLAVYLSYSVLAGLAVALSAASVGFLSALYFLRTFISQEP